MTESCILEGGTFILLKSTMVGGGLVIVDGVIERIFDRKSWKTARDAGAFKHLPVLDCSGSIIVPRLVEMHIHGAFGKGFETIKSPDDILFLAQKLRSRGIGAFVPTIIWDEAVVENLVAAIKASQISKSVLPGIHIEGPFINASKRGGIGLGNICPPEVSRLERILEITDGYMKIMTLAPELPGVEKLYAVLEKHRVLVSFGHSDARGTFELPGSDFSITHLFNAMSGIDHRKGNEGLANLACTGLARWVELNADGVHVNPTAMRVARQCVSTTSLILTSDAVVSAGLPFGEYRYFEKPVGSGIDGVRYKESGTLIGSSRLGMEIVSSFMKATGSPLHEAVAAMSKLPSLALGMDISNSGGSIEEGARADLYLWDPQRLSCRPVSSAFESAPNGKASTENAPTGKLPKASKTTSFPEKHNDTNNEV